MKGMKSEGLIKAYAYPSDTVLHRKFSSFKLKFPGGGVIAGRCLPTSDTLTVPVNPHECQWWSKTPFHVASCQCVGAML